MNNPGNCEHIFGMAIVGLALVFVRVTGRWFQKCVFCRCTKIYSSMVQCVECGVFAHERCVQWTPTNAYRQAETKCDRCGRAVDRVDASTNTDAIVVLEVATTCDPVDAATYPEEIGQLATTRRSVDASTNTETTTETVVATTYPPVDAAISTDTVELILATNCPSVDAATSAELTAETEVVTTSCPSVEVTTTPVMEADVDVTSESEDIIPYVLPVMEVNRAQDLNKTYKLWEARFNLFSRFNEGIMADRETLYSGPPEVLAKHIASRCKKMETIIDPFCGSGAIAIQLAMVGRKVIAMDRNPANIKCAQNNARVYGVEDRIRFVVGDFFTNWDTLDRADGIVTSPPKELGKRKTAELMRLTSRVVPKVLLKLPINRDKAELYRMGSSCFKRVHMEAVSVNRELTSVNVYLGPVTNNDNTRSTRNEAAQRVDTDVHLFTDGVAVNRRVDFIRGNNLFAYDEYLNNVDKFIN